MPVFTYKGTNRAGTNVTGERTANSKAELTAMLRREQINVSKVSEKGKEFQIPTFGAGVESKDPWGNLRTGAEATAVIKRSDYGLKFNAPLETGGVMLSDDVHVHLDIELIKKV